LHVLVIFGGNADSGNIPTCGLIGSRTEMLTKHLIGPYIADPNHIDCFKAQAFRESDALDRRNYVIHLAKVTNTEPGSCVPVRSESLFNLASAAVIENSMQPVTEIVIPKAEHQIATRFK
jgi:hypothetical protein